MQKPTKPQTFDKSRIYPRNVSAESSIVLEDEDACRKKTEEEGPKTVTYFVPGLDPRFQQVDQTLRCYVMFVDFHHCEHILGEGHEACTWFKQVYSSICPNAWIERWTSNVEEGKMGWPKKNFPDVPYGKRCTHPTTCNNT